MSCGSLVPLHINALGGRRNGALYHLSIFVNATIAICCNASQHERYLLMVTQASSYGLLAVYPRFAT